MVIVSCSGKFHAFALAEQLQRHDMLTALYSVYSYKKNTLMRRFVSRRDEENIDIKYIHTAIPLAIAMKLRPNPPVWNELYDQWVAKQIRRHTGAKAFIGWSGMSEHSIRQAKAQGLLTIVERGSSHICTQNDILREEYARFGQKFLIDQRVIDKELREYELADYISIPSDFVRDSFLAHGIPAKKLIQNAYGTSSSFHKKDIARDTKFNILYLGAISVQKGVIYMLEALKQLSIPAENIGVYFIGGIKEEMKPIIEAHSLPSWTFLGHINHYDLPTYLSKMDVAVQPSLQDGFGMVIIQMLACGIPVIATTNTGGPDIIREGETGYIVPIRDPKAIAECIEFLYQNPEKLAEMQQAAPISVQQGFTWNDYGDRYVANLNNILQA